MATEWLADDAFKEFKKRFSRLAADEDINEDTTRFRIIDTLLTDILPEVGRNVHRNREVRSDWRLCRLFVRRRRKILAHSRGKAA